MILQKQTTGTIFLLGMGISTPFSGTASNSSCLSSNELSVYEAKYAMATKSSFTIDKYVKQHYTKLEKSLGNFKSANGSLFNAVQKLGQEQISLDKDFLNILDELLISKTHTMPSKKRF